MDSELIGRILNDAVEVGGAPGIVAQLRSPSHTEFLAVGLGDLRARAPRAPEDRFRIGSLTKVFTAVITLQLVAEGTVALDDPVERWLPGVVHGAGHDGSSITVEQLLQQTSGIFNYSLDPTMLADFFCPRFLDTRFNNFPPEHLVEVAMTHPPLFAPGRGWQYSNTNYVLAGMIIETATDRSYADNVIERISTPLGLEATFLPETSILPTPHCRHYSRDAQGVVHDVTEQNVSHAWAAGGLVSATTDLETFVGAVLGGHLLPGELTGRMTSTVSTADSGWIPQTRYGLGVFSQTLPGGVDVWGGGGAVNGSWTYCMGSRDGTRMVTANINGDWADGRWNTPIDIFTDILQAAFAAD